MPEANFGFFELLGKLLNERILMQAHAYRTVGIFELNFDWAVMDAV